MKRFCKECGKEAKPEHKVCIHCGTPLPPLSDNKQVNTSETAPSRENSPQRKEERPKMPRKKKIWWSVVGTIVVLFIGFSVWAQNYQSPEAVHKRFVKAATTKDVKSLQNLVIHGDGSSATKGEANALLTLVEEEGEYALNELFSVEADGKFLLLFEANKVLATDQYAYYSDAVEGLTFTFNDYEPKQRKKKYYGPLIPGTYDVKATFEGEYGETAKDGEVTLADVYGSEQSLDMDLSIADVSFYVENSDFLDTEKSHVAIGDNKIELDTSGYTEPVGPFILDGSQTAMVVASLPWGEVESEPVDISEQNVYLYADLLSKKDFDDVSNRLLTFGEQHAEAFAEKSTDVIKDASDDAEKSVKDQIDSNIYDDNIFYTGELVDVEMDRHSVKPVEDEDVSAFAMKAAYKFNDSYHELEEDPDLSESTVTYQVTMKYNEEDKSWFIEKLDQNMWFGIDATDTVRGSGDVYGPSEKAIKTAKNNATEEEMEQFILDYTEASVAAINAVDFSYVSDYIVKDSPRWTEASEYIDYLDSKDITEDFLDATVETVEEVDDHTWEVTILESFTIYKDDTADDKDYRTTVIVKEIDDTLYVHELIETNER